MTPPDLSGLSIEELRELERKGSEAASRSTPRLQMVPKLAPKPPPNRGGRPKGYPVSGAAKIAKERAQKRREREQKERDERGRSPRRYDAAIAWPAPLGRGRN